MSKELRICPGVGARKCGAFLARLDRDPHPTCTRCRGKVCTKDMTCDFCAVWSAEQWDLFAQEKILQRTETSPFRLCSLCSADLPRRGNFFGSFAPWDFFFFFFPPFRWGRGSRGGLGVHLVLCLVGLPPLPARSRSSERGGSASRHLSGVGGLASSSPLPSGWWRWGSCPLSTDFPFPSLRVLWTLPHSHRTFHDVRMQRESSGSCSRAVSSRDSRSSVREPRKDTRARSRRGWLSWASPSLSLSLLLPVRGPEVGSGTGGLRPRHARLVVAHGESGRGLLTAIALDVEALGRGVPGPGPRTGTGHAVTALDVSGLGLLPVTAPAVSVRVPLLVGGGGAIVRDRTLPRGRSFDRSRSRERLSASSSRSREAGAARRVRRGTQEGVEAVASQPAAVPGGSGDVTPVAGGTSLTALPVCYEGACQILFESVWLLFPGSLGRLCGSDRFGVGVGGSGGSLFNRSWSGHFLWYGSAACGSWRFA